MSRRSAVVVLVSAYFLFGASVAHAEQPGNQDDWKEIIQLVDQVQLYILRFSPFLLAVAMVAICGTLGAIWSAIGALDANVQSLRASMNLGLARLQEKK